MRGGTGIKEKRRGADLYRLAALRKNAPTSILETSISAGPEQGDAWGEKTTVVTEGRIGMRGAI